MDSVYRLNPDITLNDMQDELIVMNEITEEVLGISGCGMEIIRLLSKSELNIIEINNQISEKYVMEEEVIIMDSINTLLECNVIQKK